MAYLVLEPGARLGGSSLNSTQPMSDLLARRNSASPNGAVDTLLNKLLRGRVKNRCVDTYWLWKVTTARQSRRTTVKEGMMSDESLEP